MAKEQFREWRMGANLRVTYKISKTESRVWAASQQELLDAVIKILAYYKSLNIIVTSRQVYYQLVKANIIPNAEEVYKKICAFLTLARYAGEIDWNAVADLGRVTSIPAEWDSVEDLVKSAIYSYRLPRWSDQKYHVELFCEKQSGETVLKPIAEKWHVRFGYNKGYSSAAALYELAQRIKEKINDGKLCVVLYIGDADSSGLDMIRDIRERITEFLLKGDEPIYGFENGDGEGNITNKDAEPLFQVVPLALNFEQVKQYDLRPNPAKTTDPRAKWFIERYGNESYELDSLDPMILRQIAEDGILQFLSKSAYTKWLAQEKEEKKALEEFGKKLARKAEREAKKK